MTQHVEQMPNVQDATKGVLAGTLASASIMAAGMDFLVNKLPELVPPETMANGFALLGIVSAASLTFVFTAGAIARDSAMSNGRYRVVNAAQSDADHAPAPATP